MRYIVNSSTCPKWNSNYSMVNRGSVNTLTMMHFVDVVKSRSRKRCQGEGEGDRDYDHDCESEIMM